MLWPQYHITCLNNREEDASQNGEEGLGGVLREGGLEDDVSIAGEGWLGRS